MEDKTAFGDLIGVVDDFLITFIFQSFNHIHAEFGNYFKYMFILAIAIYGFLIMVQYVQTPLNTFIMTMVKILVIYNFVIYWGVIEEYLVNTLTEGPEKLALALIPGSDLDGEIMAIDVIFNTYDKIADLVVKNAGWNDIVLHLVSWIIRIFAVLLCVAAAGLIVISKLLLGVLLALAPFFIVLALFKFTSGLFEGWLRSTLNFALFPVFVYVILTMLSEMILDASLSIVSFEDSFIGADKAVIDYYMLSIYCAISALGIIVFTQVPNVSAAIAGGITVAGMQSFSNLKDRVSRAAKTSAHKATHRSNSNPNYRSRGTNIITRNNQGNLRLTHDRNDNKRGIFTRNKGQS